MDRTTLSRKLMCGYQGWFAVPTDSIARGWYHYQKSGRFEPGSCSIDLWPDLTEADPDERYATSFLKANGTVATVYSAQNRKTVLRHFRWMRDYRIDGVFVQRFITEITGAGGRQFNNVLASCRSGANMYGRVFAVMYDLSGLGAGKMQSVIADWKMLVDGMHITADSAYLHHNGKPVVAVWGVGFNDGRSYTLAECESLAVFLKDDPVYGGNTLMLGVPTYWLTLKNDAVADSALHRVIRRADIVSPWMVGRPAVPDDATNLAKNVIVPDLAWCARNGKDYLPVVFPGFSWHNLNGGALNQIPRLKGRFLWRQYYEYVKAGATMLYQAMFDEMDEATAIFKCTNDPPVGASTFMTYDGLPSDFYLRLAGEGGALLRGERALKDSVPVPATAVNEHVGPGDRPSDPYLLQAYPNPFNPSVTVRYVHPEAGCIRLSVFDLLGREVAVLADGISAAGIQSAVWNAAGVPSGIYVARLVAGGTTTTTKMVLSK